MFKKKEGGGFFDRLKTGLEKTRKTLASGIEAVIFGERVIDSNLYEELEAVLVSADVGAVFASELIDEIKEEVKRKELNNPAVLKNILMERMADILKAVDKPLELPKNGPYAVMVVGVNGTGKTTTIGKLAHYFREEDRSVMLVAADTFRAAAIEQLEVWSKRSGASFVKQKMGSDPSSVVFDAVKAALSRKTDVMLIDTAGRLHTKSNLMEELKKMKRVMGRELPGSPHEVLLVLDATTGQNAVVQAKMFNEEVGVTGIVLTKLDGTSKGGIVVRIAHELKIPVRFIGIGEGIDDLRPFDGEEFVKAIFE
ncbi:MAG TPA: signal recognition particle-docking protein FtsY [Syntrophales bacterium]|nr:signal recognition particle-docking protein FtsY [Syntrophales bacterium]HRT27057.1 signal recognition particle-docking protein FtsY [Syntrophales bacterium]HRT71773.1 signal recognition particle-docking protein FtsY [Syntrophales bacterium]